MEISNEPEFLIQKMKMKMLLAMFSSYLPMKPVVQLLTWVVSKRQQSKVGSFSSPPLNRFSLH